MNKQSNKRIAEPSNFHNFDSYSGNGSSRNQHRSETNAHKETTMKRKRSSPSPMNSWSPVRSSLTDNSMTYSRQREHEMENRSRYGSRNDRARSPIPSKSNPYNKYTQLRSPQASCSIPYYRSRDERSRSPFHQASNSYRFASPRNERPRSPYRSAQSSYRISSPRSDRPRSPLTAGHYHGMVAREKRPRSPQYNRATTRDERQRSPMLSAGHYRGMVAREKRHRSPQYNREPARDERQRSPVLSSGFYNRTAARDERSRQHPLSLADSHDDRSSRMGYSNGSSPASLQNLPPVIVPASYNVKKTHFGDWKEVTSSSGKVYYFNTVTEESQWVKPKDWKNWEERHLVDFSTDKPKQTLHPIQEDVLLSQNNICDENINSIRMAERLSPNDSHNYSFDRNRYNGRNRSGERNRFNDSNHSLERNRSNDRDRSGERNRSKDVNLSHERMRSGERNRSYDRDRCDERNRSYDRDRCDERNRSKDVNRSNERMRSGERNHSKDVSRANERMRSGERNYQSDLFSREYSPKNKRSHNSGPREKRNLEEETRDFDPSKRSRLENDAIEQESPSGVYHPNNNFQQVSSFNSSGKGSARTTPALNNNNERDPYLKSPQGDNDLPGSSAVANDHVASSNPAHSSAVSSSGLLTVLSSFVTKQQQQNISALLAKYTRTHGIKLSQDETVAFIKNALSKTPQKSSNSRSNKVQDCDEKPKPSSNGRKHIPSSPVSTPQNERSDNRRSGSNNRGRGRGGFRHRQRSNAYDSPRRRSPPSRPSSRNRGDQGDDHQRRGVHRSNLPSSTGLETIKSGGNPYGLWKPSRHYYSDSLADHAREPVADSAMKFVSELDFLVDSFSSCRFFLLG